MAIASPSTQNYSVLKGQIFFTPDNGSEQDLGNAPEVVLAINVDKLDHFSSRSGIRNKDKSVIREREATLRVVLDEITPYNLRLALLGSALTENTDGNQEFGIGGSDSIDGSIRFQGTNSVGHKIQLDLPDVSVTPSGTGLNLISDEWGQIELEFEVLYVESLSDFGTCAIEEGSA